MRLGLEFDNDSHKTRRHWRPQTCFLKDGMTVKRREFAVNLAIS